MKEDNDERDAAKANIAGGKGSSDTDSSISALDYLQIATDLFDHVNRSTYDMTWRRGTYPGATAAYNAILRAWQLVDGQFPEAKFTELKGIAGRRDNYDDYEHNHETYFPFNNETYGILMDAALENSSYSSTNTSTTTTAALPPERLPDFCEAVLRHMTSHPAKGIGEAKWPDASTFARCYQALAQSGLPEASERAYTLFLTQKETARLYHSARMNDRCLVALLRALLAAPTPPPPLLDRRTRRSRGAYPTLSLPGQRLRLDYAEEVRGYAYDSQSRGRPPHTAERFSVETYTVLVTAWLDYYASGRRARYTMNVAIDQVCHLLQIASNIHGRSDHSHDRAAVTSLLDRTLRVVVTSEPSMLDLQRAAAAHDDWVKSVGPMYVPSSDGLGSMVMIHAKQGRLDNAERLLTTMVIEYRMEPTCHVYQELLNAWWQFGMSSERKATAAVEDAANRAERHFFALLTSKEQQRVDENEDSDGAVKHHDVATATIHRSACRVIDLWARCHCLAGIQSLVSRILDDDGHLSRIKPNTPLLTHILRAYATIQMQNDSSVAAATNSHDNIEKAAEMANALLAKMQHRSVNGVSTVRPTNECYQLVIRAWGRTRRPDRIDKCMAVFEELRSAYQGGLLGIQPSDQLYYELLRAMSKEGDAKSAFRLLDQMVQDYDAGNACAVPKIDTFNMVLLTCLRSHDKTAGISYGRQSYDLLTANERRFDIQANEKTYSILAELLDDESFRGKEGHFTSSLHGRRQSSKGLHQLQDFSASVASANRRDSAKRSLTNGTCETDHRRTIESR